VFRETAEDGGRFLFDLPRAVVAEFIKRVTFYRLRAKVEIAEAADLRVFASWGAAATLPGLAAPDPRLAALGLRALTRETVATNASEADYDAHRIGLGVPEGGLDFAFGEPFPHDIDMDQLTGIDFKKGCYVGQEVVSRMEHRGTARRRFVVAHGAGPLPAAGTPVNAGVGPLGTLGSSIGDTGLALVRLDRAKAAMDAGTAITTGGVALTLTLPAWARFGWPGTSASGD
jgi:folate-binding protein YgfZ